VATRMHAHLRKTLLFLRCKRGRRERNSVTPKGKDNGNKAEHR
jgi:hypothetical protein